VQVFKHLELVLLAARAELADKAPLGALGVALRASLALLLVLDALSFALL
jgi:hypothetical protein